MRVSASEKGREAGNAFSEQAPLFDELNDLNGLSVYLRALFRKEVSDNLRPGDKILEINCGTGMDALYFAKQGFDVLATDASHGMIRQTEKKRDLSGLNNFRVRLCSYHDLDELGSEKFDYIISNFGGLNCTGELDRVLAQFEGLLNPGGRVTLMIMPKICPWELLMAVKGKFRTAFRRLPGKTRARVEGNYFDCYYYNPGYVSRSLGKKFIRQRLTGVCITVPPEFFAGFTEKYPKLFRVLKTIDRRLGNTFPFDRCCDHFMVTFRKTK